MREQNLGSTRIAITLLKGLEPWQVANVSSFLASAVSQVAGVGEVYRDGDGTEYLPMLAVPVVVYGAKASRVRRTLTRALDSDVAVAIYPRGLFETYNDEDNRAVAAALSRDDLDLVGVAVVGPEEQVRGVVKGLSLHR